jgi:hypothetical protein
VKNYTVKLETIKKIRAFCYATLGIVLSWNAYQHDKYVLMLCTATFVICMVGLTLSSIGTTKITWDDYGVTRTKFPSTRTEIPWSEITKINADPLGYDVHSSRVNFRISRANMPEELLARIKQSIAKNKSA